MLVSPPSKKVAPNRLEQDRLCFVSLSRGALGLANRQKPHTGTYRVPSLNGFHYEPLPGFTGFYWSFSLFSLVLFGFQWIFFSFTGFHWVLLFFTRFLPSFNGFYWVLPSFTVFS